MNSTQILFELLNTQHTEAHFEALLQILDRLHDGAAANNLEAITPLTPQEVLGWLDDLAYTVEETMQEIKANLATKTEAKSWYNN